MDKDLKELLEVFGSEFSPEDIASAYGRSNHDKFLAAEYLCTAENTAALKMLSEFDRKASISSEIPWDNVLGEASVGQQGTTEFMLESGAASMGVVSSIIGKEYANPRPLKSESVEVKKPLKLQAEDLPGSESWEQNYPSMETRTNYAKADVEEFLFRMLGEGFQLDRHKIQEVLVYMNRNSGMSVDRLLDLSAATMERSEETVVAAKNSTETACSDKKSVSLEEPMQQLDSSISDGAKMMSRNASPKAKRGKNKNALGNELLQSLFHHPGRCEEAPMTMRTVPRRLVKVPKRFSKLVVEPHNDDLKKDNPSTVEALVVSKEEDADNCYDALRNAVKEYRSTTKEYYKAAIDAFTQGDQARAYKLLEQGKFFNKRARETDAESFEKLLETREGEETAIPIKLQDFEPKEAVQLLRQHLASLTGIQSVKYLRVFVNSSDRVSTNKARKKLIVKLLEKESIKWNEEENEDSILIQVAEVDPKRLSFANKERLEGSHPSYLGYTASRTSFLSLVGKSTDKRQCWVSLTQLVLRFCGADFKILHNLLESFPYMEDLQLKYQDRNHRVALEVPKKGKNEIHCLKNSLKFLTLKSFKGKVAEMQITKYFLERAQLLKQVKIYAEKELEMEVLKKLHMLPRCSGTCQIVVFSI